METSYSWTSTVKTIRHPELSLAGGNAGVQMGFGNSSVLQISFCTHENGHWSAIVGSVVMAKTIRIIAAGAGPHRAVGAWRGSPLLDCNSSFPHKGVPLGSIAMRRHFLLLNHWVDKGSADFFQSHTLRGAFRQYFTSADFRLCLSLEFSHDQRR